MKALWVGLIFLIGVAVLAGVGVLVFPLLVAMVWFLRFILILILLVAAIWLLGKFIIFVWEKISR